MTSLPGPKEITQAAEGLQIAWVGFHGSWEAFEDRVRRKGTVAEKAVIESYPREFRVSAVQRAARLDNWARGRLTSWIVGIEALTRANKSGRNGEEVPDNRIRMQALQYLIDLATRPRAQESRDHGGATVVSPTDPELVEQLRALGSRMSEQRSGRRDAGVA
ncbi:MAG: hypothetical protein ACE5EF_00035 [Dehalococcoidia bacterium]